MSFANVSPCLSTNHSSKSCSASYPAGLSQPRVVALDFPPRRRPLHLTTGYQCWAEVVAQGA